MQIRLKQKTNVWRSAKIVALFCGAVVPVFGASSNAPVPSPPARLVTRIGDQSIILHWDEPGEPGLAGYLVYRSTNPSGGFTTITPSAVPNRNFADLTVTNGQTFHYFVRALNATGQQSSNSTIVSATARAFAGDDDFLDYLQHTAFDYFWYEANPANGLVRDRSEQRSPSSIAAIGFGLTGTGIAIDHGWITREEGRDRTLSLLRTLLNKPQGRATNGMIGYRGWFYHFLDMNSAARAGNCELSSIDTALLLAGILYSRQYFNGADAGEATLRRLASEIYARVDWQWMLNGKKGLAMGWRPETGFLRNQWIGYNEAMILYLLGLGAGTNPVAPSAWDTWISGYSWQTNYGYSFVPFARLFGHQYSHCWVDFRHIADSYMGAQGITYFENSRRATLAQRQYCIANPKHHTGYSGSLWGLTACDGPGSKGFFGYMARGAPPPENDDGTIAPTAAGGSLPVAPEVCLPTLRYLYTQFRTNIWTGYGFRDAFNLRAGWWDPDVLGIDQGPILIMAENYRSQKVWELFSQVPEIQRGLAAAGFTNVPPVSSVRRQSGASRNF